MAVERAALLAFAATVVGAAAALPVLEDEAYYWTWSRALAPHYFDHPPLIAWLIRAAQTVFVSKRLALRGVSLGCMALAIWAMAATAARLRGRRVPRTLTRRRPTSVVAWGVAGSLLFTVGLLPATPDAPLAALLGLAGYAVVRAAEGRDDTIWSVAAGGLFGFAVLAKLSGGVAAVGVAAGTWLTRAGRRQWRRPGPWLGVLVGSAIVGSWWAVAPALPEAVTYQMGRVTAGTTRWALATPLTLGGALLVLGPAIGVGIGRALANARHADSSAQVSLLAGAAAVLVACWVAVGLGSGELNWLLPVLVCGWPAAVAAAPADRWSRLSFRLAQGQAAVVGLVLLHIIWPFIPVEPARDRTLRAAGWRAVATRVQEEALRVGAGTIVTDTYQRASLLRFHLDDRWPVHERDGRRPSQFDRWPRPTICPGEPVIVVSTSSTSWPGFAPTAPPIRVVRRRAGRAVATLFVRAERSEIHAGRGGCAGGSNG